MSRGILFVLSGPSGAGKGTLRRLLFQRLPGLAYSVSCTTRQPRPGETEGVEYHFVSEEAFREMIAQGRFLEWAKVHDHFYGTRASDVREVLERGLDVVLEIDVQGALQVKKAIPEAVTLFIDPPSVEELERRLSCRGTEAPEERRLRLMNAKAEMEQARSYDHRVVNDHLEEALEDLAHLVEFYRGKRMKEGTP
ncbi:guanylate kinase [Aminomonas paucivorans]|uniref:Guanylate kinase n=1 Tax=Aminomonas paucivorans DSM 12260 TaxID=584708 RepID=E3CYA8_9BACT|nr:guanylate kinase [Aminomonas paucivorans]EFQ23641.1 guanylate kinase [Aminomonas paucivorans DSM 12260]